MSVDPDEEIARLGSRVRWLDRYRRVIAVPAAISIGAVLLYVLGEGFASRIHIFMFSIILAMIAWYLIELVFAAILAVWETRESLLSREPGLPRAELLRRRKR